MFEDVAEPEEPTPPQIGDMHRFYGRLADHQCWECRHLIAFHYDRAYYKCGLTRWTSGPATDWRLKWTACGAFEERF